MIRAATSSWTFSIRLITCSGTRNKTESRAGAASTRSTTPSNGKVRSTSTRRSASASARCETLSAPHRRAAVSSPTAADASLAEQVPFAHRLIVDVGTGRKIAKPADRITERGQRTVRSRPRRGFRRTTTGRGHRPVFCRRRNHLIRSPRLRPRRRPGLPTRSRNYGSDSSSCRHWECSRAGSPRRQLQRASAPDRAGRAGSG